MPNTTGPAVRAEGLGKRFGRTPALNGFDLTVPQGTVCSLLGPNGAGKSTAVRVLSTLLRPDTGRAEVGGFDVLRQPTRVRGRIGLVGQYPALDNVLSARANLEMFARLYHLGPRAARARAAELLEQFELTDVAHVAPKKYSGGMRRRLDLAISFVMNPPVLFLDEPTTGLDPRHRREVWQEVRRLVRQGTSVLLTTHYLDEADELADHVSVLDRGRVIARGSPDELRLTVGGDRIDVLVGSAAELATARDILARVTGAEPESYVDTGRVSAPVRDRIATLTDALRTMENAGLTVRDIGLRRPTLEEVFIRLTGHSGEAASDTVDKPLVSDQTREGDTV